MGVFVYKPLVKFLGKDVFLQACVWLIWAVAAGVFLWGSGADVAVQRALLGSYDQHFNSVMRGLGWLGLGRNQVILCVFSAALCWRKRRAVAVVWLSALPAFAVAGISVIVLKMLVGRPRPKAVFALGADPYAPHPVWDHGFTSAFQSFPSGHSASTMAICTLLALGFPKYRAWILAFGAAACASRFLAVTPHFLGDVVAGAGLGIAAGLAVWHGLAAWRTRVCNA